MQLEEIGLPSRVTRVLAANGLLKCDDVIGLNARELLALSSFGDGSLTTLEAALSEHGLVLAADPFGAYVCDREGEVRRDANLASVILCERCSGTWQEGPFAGTAPAFVGSRLEGYCLNCNELRYDLHLFQWFLCGNCERVARSIGRSTVAARSVMKAWDELVRPAVPYVELRDVDAPRLFRNTPEARAARVASSDFVAVDTRDDRAVLAIEMKTGKGYIEGQQIGSKIARFQLDVSDCNEVLLVTARDEVPVYLLHAQVIDRAEPPTLRYVALAHWWTDPFAMEANFVEVRTRSRETRPAAYYNTAMFRRMTSLGHHVANGGLDEVLSLIHI